VDEGCFGLTEASIRKGVLVRAATGFYGGGANDSLWINPRRTTTNMKLNLKHVGIHSTNALDSWVEKQILALGETRQIDEANIELSHHAERSPAYEVRIHLVTPGPDLFEEARDHTIRAAFTKALAELREKITGRATKRLRRVKSNLSAPAAKARTPQRV
jgi:ribosome-associated translation inhibitor RaiA